VYLQPNGVPVGDQAIILTQAPGAPVMVEQLPPPLVSPTIPPGQAVPNAPGKPNPMATYKPLAPIPYRTDTSEFRKHLGELAAERTELDKLRQNLKELSADRAYENEKEQIRQKIQDLILKRGAQILRAPARAQVTYDEPPTVAPQTQPRLPDQFEPPLKPKPMPMIPEKPAVEPVIEPRSVFISSAIPGAAESGLLAAQNYFMLAKYREALEQCERIDLLRLHPDDKQATLFLKATCLRKLGSLKESAEAYKEVIVMEGDEMLVECAQWHIQGIRWRLETDANLQKLKQRRIALEQSLREEKQP
jgi:tetratricopeptide (TPR) repeat protein